MNNIYGLGQNLIQVQASGHLIVVFSYLFCLMLLHFLHLSQLFNDFPPQEYQQTKGEQKQDGKNQNGIFSGHGIAAGNAA